MIFFAISGSSRASCGGSKVLMRSLSTKIMRKGCCQSDHRESFGRTNGADSLTHQRKLHPSPIRARFMGKPKFFAPRRQIPTELMRTYLHRQITKSAGEQNG